MSSVLLVVFTERLQSQAIRLAVSLAMGPTPFRVGRFAGHLVSKCAAVECAGAVLWQLLG